MTCFDNSLVYCKHSSSATKTYNSYMCPSRDSYFIQDHDKYIEGSSDIYNCLWNASPDKYIQSRPPHISKLRNILSETISDITRDSKLQKGESVELTLEIELMRTGSNTPTNPLVEVTIIQHNKAGTLTKHSFVSNKVMTNKMPFHTEMISPASESASQKRRNWFQRVIRPNETSLNEEFTNRKMEEVNGYKWKTKDTVVCNNEISILTENNNKTIKNPRSNFCTVLPEEIPINGDYTKGYRKVSPGKRTPKNVTKLKKPRNIMTASRKDSLVKKLSDIFLPTRKVGKNEAVKTALTALKQEVDNMKLKNDKDTVKTNSRKRKRAQVHNLGKLVSNILVDVMDNPNYTSSNEVKDNNSIPVQYQSFFEPITKGINQNKERKLNKRKTNIHEKKLCESHSDTCCLYSKQKISGLTMKSSNSVSDCRAQSNTKTQTEPLYIYNGGDSPQIFSKKKTANKDKSNRRNQRKNAKGDANSQANQVSAKSIKHSKQKSSVQAKSSLIQWNGQTIPVNKEVKARIEMLIVNELQNLALKEGMECDVTPLPSTDSSTKNVEKMSSFICELDISDKMFQKTIDNKKSSDSKLNANQLPKITNKKNQKSSKNVTLKKSKTIKASSISNKSKKLKGIQDSNGTSNDHTLKSNEVKNNGPEQINSILLQTNEEEEHDVEVTYFNANAKNWSAESNTVQFESPEMKESQVTKIISKESHIFQFSASQSCYQPRVSSGFVKRIRSNDSTWKNYLSKDEITKDRNLSQQSSKQLVTVTSTRATVKQNSSTSNEYESSIEIELDIKDLEMILKEAKQKQQAEKVLISAKCKHNIKKQKKHIKFTGKNSPSYTNQLLTNAAKKLEKYVKKR